MAKRRKNRAVFKLHTAMASLFKATSKAIITWLLRVLLLVGCRPLAHQRGFVLPTTMLLLLVVSLTVGAITLRTLNRTAQATGERQTQVIYNAATPAIDRAKAKLEFMFSRQRDSRLPTGIPGEGQLVGMLVNDGRTRNGLAVPQLLISTDAGDRTDPYTFPDEERTAATVLNLSADLDVDGNNSADRLDIDGDGLPDNAWAYRVDLDGDNVEDATVAYSILLQTPDDPAAMEQISDAAMASRAIALEVRHGPLSNGANLTSSCQVNGDGGAAPIEDGWFRDSTNSSILRKNFQVNAFVLPDNPDGTVATLEFHQDRQLAQGNKWGAWFRNDLEIFPGPQFNWNGAMHTEGNLVVGNNNFRGYLVSAPASCLYSREASEITITDIEANPDQDIPAFQGQILSARINDNSFGYRSDFHLFDTNPIITGDNNVRLDQDRDSVRHGSSTPRPADYALDPIALLTRDVSQARGTADPSAFRANDWNANDKMFVQKGRIYNQSEDAPYLDDFYRADDRYGPKPRYGGRRIPGNIGEPITGDLMVDDGLSDVDLTNNDASEPTNVGLDGYWERRARREGLRLIVGQRLDVGDAFGWGMDLNENGILENTERQAEPLNPANSCPGSRCHETLQRRTLYDNLAAVQSLAIYHSASDNGTFPIACLALTAHPGTAETITASRTFDEVTWGGATLVNTDFLTGRGTDGWEFDPPAGVSGADSEDDFADAIAYNPTSPKASEPLAIALHNLAHFAGDPRGGAPSFTPVQDDTVHPYPHLTMWGDYSILRRILAMLDGGTAADGNPMGGTVAYADLSPADQATLHTAACTVGMLAYNLDLSQGRYEALYGATLSDFGQALWELIDGNLSNGEVNTLVSSPVPFPAGYNRNSSTAPNAASFYGQFSTDDYIEALKNKPGITLTADQIDAFAATIMEAQQIRRDRLLGFVDGGFSVEPTTGSSIDWNPATGQFTEGLTSGSFRFQTECDPDSFSTLNNSAMPGLSNDERDERKIGLAAAFCSSVNHPKYPALYYLFPVVDHDHNGANDSAIANIPDHRQPTSEEYISDSYIFNGSDGVNDGYLYLVLEDGDNDGVEESGDDGIGAIALTPHGFDFDNDWSLPTGDSGINTIYATDGSPLASVPFLDKGIYNGREMMGVRVLDVDWGLLHNNTQSLGNDRRSVQDHWLPNSAVVYGVREDAVREDAINRPVEIGANWSTCGQNATFESTSGTNNAQCRMEANPANPQDPPLFDRNQISPKAVDYYPDPLRRPSGFRMRNGAELWRDNDRGRGLSFISDTPVYIQGDLNLHQTFTPDCTGDESCRLEEFTQKLPTGGSYNTTQFYTDRDTLDVRFANPLTDKWRPTEVLADAITIISESFCDGSMEDSFVTAGDGSGASISDSETRYGCSGNGDRTSYLDQNRPDEDITDDGFDWLRADPANPNSPILISRNGMPMITNGTTLEPYDDEYGANDFFAFNSQKPLINAATTRVNAIIISGLVPSRTDQAYGGMHNFPRFIENWTRLYISGGLLQLNFSNYATAPFDQDAWESNQNTTGSELIRYYSPPNRLWGYDVALQYSPAGPIASRFVSAQAIRSEFYSEPPADDQYMINLCRAIATDPNSQCAI